MKHIEFLKKCQNHWTLMTMDRRWTKGWLSRQQIMTETTVYIQYIASTKEIDRVLRTNYNCSFLSHLWRLLLCSEPAVWPAEYLRDMASRFFPLFLNKWDLLETTVSICSISILLLHERITNFGLPSLDRNLNLNFAYFYISCREFEYLSAWLCYRRVFSLYCQRSVHFCQIF